jgi:uncharacterized protein YbjT (DUF2867 family)
MILVTGATGTVGQFLTLELKIKKIPFRVLTRDPEKARNLLGPVDLVIGSTARPDTILSALQGVESAFLLSPLDPDLPSWEIGFAKLCKKAGVQRLVKLSALGAENHGTHSIARWHGQSEEEIRACGIPFTFLRPAGFYQNFFNLHDGIRKGSLAAPMGGARMSFVDARDIAAVAAIALTQSAYSGQSLALTGPRSLTYSDIAALFSSTLKRPVHYTDITPANAERGMQMAGLPAWMTDALLGLSKELRTGQADIVTQDIQNVLGREPISLETFIAEHRARFL